MPASSDSVRSSHSSGVRSGMRIFRSSLRKTMASQPH
nr:MAG TPA: hypothetical protein [Caudoviricetes sp.]DAU46766.1 MAG TPA: hypothetical protein [Caudoviricetes sp.]